MNNLNLYLENGHKLFFNDTYLSTYKKDIMDFLENTDISYMNNINFAKKMMMSQEIKSNNTIEGINDNIERIDDVIKNRFSYSEDERKRIINLYHGYQYILNHKEINKETLKVLYNILSNDLLDDYAKKNMGKYYREKTVYILKGNRLDVEPYEGVNTLKIAEFMDNLLYYINKHEDETYIDNFIKSQIIHFYFVYIHPYFDVNGRTSRTLAMWYLLNNNNYPFIIFNRAIAFAKRKYENSIVASRKYGNITLFLKNILECVSKEFEKEYIINSIVQNSKYTITKEESQLIEYFLTMKNNFTIKDLAVIYNKYNNKQRIEKVFQEKIMPLIDKNIFVINYYTKSFITSSEHNSFISLNKDLLNVDKSKIKHLNIDDYIS